MCGGRYDPFARWLVGGVTRNFPSLPRSAR